MIPNCGPAPKASHAEQEVYHLIRKQLDDDFTVIHSLPWLSAAVREISGVKAVTGEIDFLVVHAALGVLAIEVKGGAHSVQGVAFVHIESGTQTRALEQVRASTHGLARWLGGRPGIYLRIGYALAFPHSDFEGQVTSPGLTDLSVEPPQTIVIDRPDLPQIGRRIVEIMTYWRGALRNPPLGEARMRALVSAICPAFDGTPSWGARVVWDDKTWLRLTPEQSSVIDDIVVGRSMVITGWPGTGKTLLLMGSARRLLQNGQRVLVLTFNTLLAQFIQRQLGRHKRLKVATWHAFCGSAAGRPKGGGERDTGWLEQGCVEDIQHAASQGELEPFDTILIDEAQTFRLAWIQWLSTWHADRQLVACCDETQVFAFEEERVSLAQLCRSLGVPKPFGLTIALRAPGAVYRRLRGVRRPDYQLTTPRDIEADTLQEVLVVGMPEALHRTLDMLAEKGVPESEIVVLEKYGWIASNDEAAPVRFYSVSRFRGLEAPVVIVLHAEQMDDAELFCAYSRATTLCIALYDAEVLGVKGADGVDSLFQQTLLAMPGNSAQAEAARLEAHTGEILRGHFELQWLGLLSAQIAWLPEWGAWLLVAQGDLSQFWIDYLASHYPWPIYYWIGASLRDIWMASPVRDVARESPGGSPHRVRLCQRCSFITPQRLNPLSSEECWECSLCSRNHAAPVPLPNQTVLELRRVDPLVMADDPKALSEVEKKSLPLSLAAGAAWSFAARSAHHDLAGLGQIGGGRVSYHAAVGFMYSWINLWPPHRKLEVRRIAADLYARYLPPKGLTLEQWQRDFAAAFGVAYKRGHLSKVVKGIYAITPR
ncbi:nuclease-related domain-containing DEAD/DEAH box helicase [Frateuria terrea]|uniref:Part of AAA domain-containing protein n=1 Tax=Frateuria terrea TaxID=529704 RepID=A0A1H6UCX4_9GAMM|nr:NERD domain-containing protein/DEAD/DEAH box helicase [Frateuria terrea]SEI89436.1 Part of AAA domain-containing protein [Frateuria terrea]SFP37165.1 Part of AAA domain-containing protein [Frateuria terrea]